MQGSMGLRTSSRYRAASRPKRARGHGWALIGLIMSVIGGAAVRAAPLAYTIKRPNDFQTFVVPWKPEGAPLCAFLTSQAGWDKVMHPAAVMWGNRPFSPPPSFWTDHALLLFARGMSAGAGPDVVTFDRVEDDAQTVAANFKYNPPPPQSSMVNWYVALEVRRPRARKARFIENGKPVCDAAAAP